MAQSIILDALYPEMEEATIGRWLVAVGEQLREGEPIVELITDKVVFELPSPGDGFLLAMLTAEKSVIAVGTTLGLFGAIDEELTDTTAAQKENRRLADEREANISAILQATGSVTNVESERPSTGAVRATPAARRLARERGIDLSTLTGSGAGGMITVDDFPA